MITSKNIKTEVFETPDKKHTFTLTEIYYYDDDMRCVYKDRIVEHLFKSRTAWGRITKAFDNGRDYIKYLDKLNRKYRMIDYASNPSLQCKIRLSF